MTSIVRPLRRSGVIACLITLSWLVAACHGNSNNNTSGYGIGWVTVGAVTGPQFASYVVNIDSVTMTNTLGNSYSVLTTVEPVDLMKLRDVRELWGNATIPNGTYKSATVVLDYTNAAIQVIVGGVPQKATVVNASGAAVTTVSVVINFDPNYQPVVTPSYSTDNAQLLALNVDLLASNRVNLATNPATVTVSPFLTMGPAAPDLNLIRGRGPLINSSALEGTFSIYERPFYDQVNSIGTISIFNSATTVYNLDGVPYSGAAGLNQLTQLPAGVTMTSSLLSFQPTATATAYAGKFNAVSVTAGAALQSNLTEGISGDVIAITRNAAANTNTLTLRGATVHGTLVSLAEGYFGYQDSDAQLIVGPGTVVSVDGAATATGLSYQSIAVGQHIEAVAGTYSCAGTCGTSGTGVWSFDATNADTGKVRLQSTRLYGSLVSATSGSLSLALQAINDWPVSVYNFAGNGTSTATDSRAASYRVETTGTDLSTTAAGTPLWISGQTNSFGAAPPDFIATTVSEEGTVPATLNAVWSSAGAVSAFSGLSSSGFAINLADANLASATLQVGARQATLASLPASPQIVPTTTPVALTTAPVFAPHFAYSVPVTTSGVTTTNVSVFNAFASFVGAFSGAVTTATPVLQVTASGYYNPVTNTFTANTVSIVL